MKILKLTFSLVLMTFLSIGVSAQGNPFVCLEITVDGESSIIGLTENALEETQAALAEEGIDSEVVECEDDFSDLDLGGDLGDYDGGDFDFGGGDFDFGDWDLGDDVDWDVNFGGGDFDFGDYDDYDFGGGDFDFGSGFGDVELVCLEITVDGESSIIGLTENALEETQAALAEEGIDSEVVECEEMDVLDFDIVGGADFDWADYDCPDFGDMSDYDFGDFDGWDVDFGEFVCLEITVDGESSIIGLTENALEETQAALAEEGIDSEVVECEDMEVPDFDFGDDMDWGDNGDIDWNVTGWGDGDVDFGDLDLGDFDGLEGFDFPDVGDLESVCIEFITDGESSIVTLSSNALEETLASVTENLTEQGIDFQIVECEETETTDTEEPKLVNASTLKPATNVISLLGSPRTRIERFRKTGITSMDQGINNLNVYPNPANNQDVININFDSKTEELVNVNVMNQVGQSATNTQVMTNEGRNTVTLNSTDLAPGLYLISVSNGSNLNITKKLLVTK